MILEILEHPEQGSLSLGYIVGAINVSKKKEIKKVMSHLSLFFFGISVVLIIISKIDLINNYFVLVLLPIIGFCFVSASIYWRTCIHTNTPQNILGRVSTVSSLVGDTTLPLSFALFGSGIILALVVLLMTLSQMSNSIILTKITYYT